MFSANVHKWNKYSMKQERTLVVTNNTIYNFHKKKLRRSVIIKELQGLTKALNEKSSEFVIHVKDDYDYRMESATPETRNNLFQCLKLLYLSKVKQNLPIYGIAKSKVLSDFCTSQKDVSHGISRIPMILARIYEEDIEMSKKPTYNFRISPNATHKNEPSEAEKLIDNLGSMVEHRNKA